MAKKAKNKNKTKNKPSNKGKKHQARKRGQQVEQFIDKHGITYDDLAMAGVGVLATSLAGAKNKTQTKKAAKHFDKLIARGHRLAPKGPAPKGPASKGPIPKVDKAEPKVVAAKSAEPVVSHQAHGGGWYTVQVNAVEVDRVKGEAAATERVAELVAKYAAVDLGDERANETALNHTGGGWYEVIVNGVPIARMRGRDATHERYGHLVSQA